METPVLADKQKTNIQLICAQIECCLEDLEKIMINRDWSLDGVKRIFAAGMPSWWSSSSLIFSENLKGSEFIL